MGWLARGSHGEELIFDYEPYRTCVYTSNDEKLNYWRGLQKDAMLMNLKSSLEVV